MNFTSVRTLDLCPSFGTHIIAENDSILLNWCPATWTVFHSTLDFGSNQPALKIYQFKGLAASPKIGTRLDNTSLEPRSVQKN